MVPVSVGRPAAVARVRAGPLLFRSEEGEAESQRYGVSLALNRLLERVLFLLQLWGPDVSLCQSACARVAWPGRAHLSEPIRELRDEVGLVRLLTLHIAELLLPLLFSDLGEKKGASRPDDGQRHARGHRGASAVSRRTGAGGDQT